MNASRKKNLIILAILSLFLGSALAFLRFQKPPTLAPTPLKEEGEVFGTEIPTLESFPADIPTYQPAEISSSSETKEGLQVTLRTKDPILKVEKYYLGELAKYNWEKSGEDTYIKKGRTLKIKLIEEPETSSTVIIINYKL